jgi:hypothetical protein
MTSMSIRSRADGRTPSTTAGDAPRWLRATYLIDGAGSAAIGLLLLALPGWLAAGVGVGSASIQAIGAVFVVNGLVNGHAARTMTRRAMVAPVVIDAVFGIGVLVVALSDPFGAATWARWLLGATGLLSVDLAAAKAYGRSLASG